MSAIEAMATMMVDAHGTKRHANVAAAITRSNAKRPARAGWSLRRPHASMHSAHEAPPITDVRTDKKMPKTLWANTVPSGLISMRWSTYHAVHGTRAAAAPSIC